MVTINAYIHISSELFINMNIHTTYISLMMAVFMAMNRKSSKASFIHSVLKKFDIRFRLKIISKVNIEELSWNAKYENAAKIRKHVRLLMIPMENNAEYVFRTYS